MIESNPQDVLLAQCQDLARNWGTGRYCRSGWKRRLFIVLCTLFMGRLWFGEGTDSFRSVGTPYFDRPEDLDPEFLLVLAVLTNTSEVVSQCLNWPQTLELTERLTGELVRTMSEEETQGMQVLIRSIAVREMRYVRRFPEIEPEEKPHA